MASLVCMVLINSYCNLIIQDIGNVTLEATSSEERLPVEATREKCHMESILLLSYQVGCNLYSISRRTMDGKAAQRVD